MTPAPDPSSYPTTPMHGIVPDNSTIANTVNKRRPESSGIWPGASTRAAWPNMADAPNRQASNPISSPPWGYAHDHGGQKPPQPQMHPVVYPPRQPPPNRREKASGGKKRRRIPIWARVVIGILVFFLVLGGGVLAYYETQIAPSLNNILGNKAKRQTGATGSTNSQQTTSDGQTLSNRINILLLGSDTDGKGNDPNSGGAPLAQTVMILTIDPQTNYVGMLSIPRDMQVTEAGYRAPKLDEVFSHAFTGANTADSVASAAGHMEDIIQENYGITIDHYAWVGLQGFINVINTAGGVDVDVIHPMVDDTYPDDINKSGTGIYDYKRLYIAPGPQHLDGIHALEYVRTRHSDLIGDFGRTIRQQQVLTNLKSKLTTTDVVGKAQDYLKDLSGSLYTDMTLNDVISMGNYARSINLNTVQRVTLGPPDYAVANQSGTNYLPKCEAVTTTIEKMFGTSAAATCLEQASSGTTGTTTATASYKSTGSGTTRTSGTQTTGTAGTSAVNSADVVTGVTDLLKIVCAATFESADALWS